MEDERRRLRVPGGEGPAGAGGGDEHVSDVLGRLPDDIRQALTLKYLEGMSYEEIGKLMGINANRIDYLIRKGKRMVRDRLPARRETV
jgi:DNA-directed RNA polymerase specialized sigma24 family protein